ncbi:transglycosylase domain-containing protein [Streptomyces gamaensis]|uniref:Transglycosylase domain-containing protein n=1 Tax=Streptomyces gamaensis TaxID=1763542 RepID=A0ABW0Z1J7_9ACTN
MGRADIRRTTRHRGRDKRRRNGRRRTADPGARPRKRGLRRFLTWRKVLGTVLTGCVLGVGAFLALYFSISIPEGNAAARVQSNIYKLPDGTVLARTGQVNREHISLSRIPREVQQAFVAAENKTFYEDAGVDVGGIARAALSTLTGRGRQGGSTITQQYVKNYYLDQDQTLTRKVKELIIALKVDQRQTKQEILEGYLNTSYFGRGAYGIQAAARAYYGKDADRLTVAEGAYLATLLQAPSQYDWAVAQPATKKLVEARWNYVLDNMTGMKWLDEGARRSLTFPVPADRRPDPGLGGQTGYIVKTADQELLRAGVDERSLAAGGWTVTVTIDPAKQKALEAAVKDRLTSELDPKKRSVDAAVQAGAASVDPATGAVLALYGGEDYTRHYLNNASRRDYQPASTFKPVILASALQHGSTTQDGKPITAATVYDGNSRTPVKGSAVPFAPPNEDNQDYGQTDVQRAMNNSVNTVFAQMAVDVGLGAVKKTAIDLGISEKAGGFDEKPAMSLGVMGASPLDMAGVYATFDNHGKRVTPSLVKSAVRNGHKTELPDPVGGQVLSRKTADAVTSVLTGVVNDGSGAAVRSDKYATAGKTGTSDDDKSAWFVGYTPHLVTAVGLFGEGQGGTQVSLYGAAGSGKRVGGGGYPARIWSAYTEAALSGEPSSSFDLQATAPPPPSDPPRTSAPPPPSVSPRTTPATPPTSPPSRHTTPTPRLTPDPSSSANRSGDRGHSSPPPQPGGSASGSADPGLAHDG